MSVQLHPATTLTFHRPLTQLVKRTLAIHNPNAQPIVFKVKTTAPKLYCVRPNSGTIEPRASIEVAVMLQPMKEEPPMNVKCKDKFLIQSTFIPADKETLPAAEIWSSLDSAEEGKIQQQKLKVMYLPPEGQTVHEEEETHETSMLSNGDESRYATTPARHPGGVNFQPIPDFQDSRANISQETQAPVEVQPKRPATPQQPEHVNRAPTPEPLPVQAPAPSKPEPPRVPTPVPAVAPVPVVAPAPVVAPTPAPAPARAPPTPEPVVVRPPTPPAPAPVARTPSRRQSQHQPQSVLESDLTPDQELLAKYREAQFEIERLRAVLATSTSPAPVELRRRNRTLVDDGSTVVGTDVSSAYDDSMSQTEGVPLQYVVAIAFMVFVTTYLFF